MAKIDFNNPGGDDISSLSGGNSSPQNPEPPQPKDPKADVWQTGGTSPSMFDTVSMLYRNALGRDPENAGVVNNWISGTGGNIGAIQQGIYATPEAQAYSQRMTQQGAANTATTPSTDLMSRITAALGNAKSTDDPNYWYSKISADPNGAGSAWDYWLGRINQGNGALAVRNGTTPLFNDGPAAGSPPPGGNYGGFGNGTNPGGYDDPSTVAYFNSVLSRMNQLAQPVHDPVMDQLTQTVLDRVKQLQQPAYSSADEQAMLSRLTQPLTNARDQQLQAAKERISARGMLPTSGLLDVLNNQINKNYDQGIATGTNNLAVNESALNNQRADEAVQMLNALTGINRTNRGEQNQNYDEMVRLAEAFPNFDNQRLATLLSASGEGAASPASTISGLTSLANLGLVGSNLQYNQNTDQSNAMGQFLGYLLQHGGFGAV